MVLQGGKNHFFAGRGLQLVWISPTSCGEVSLGSERGPQAVRNCIAEFLVGLDHCWKMIHPVRSMSRFMKSRVDRANERDSPTLRAMASSGGRVERTEEDHPQLLVLLQNSHS